MVISRTSITFVKEKIMVAEALEATVTQKQKYEQRLYVHIRMR